MSREKKSRDQRSGDRRAQSIEHDAPSKLGIQIDDDGDNLYAESVDAGHRIDPRAQKIFIAGVVLVIIYFAGLVLPHDIFNTELHQSGYNAGYTFSWFVKDLMENVNNLLSVFMGNSEEAPSYLSEMIRYGVIALAGAGLAVCGAVYQGSFRNSLISPSTLGVMSGSTLGMMIWIVFFVSDDGEGAEWLYSSTQVSLDNSWEYLCGSYNLALLSFAGCIAVIAVVLLVMRIGGKGKMNPIMMIITGQVIGSIMGAISNTVRYYYVSTDTYGTKAALLTELQISSFYRVFTIIDIFAIGIPLLLTFFVVMKVRRRMNLLAFSEGEAKTMGVDTKRMRISVVALCTLLTAIVVSFCGHIGFIGFMVPHLSRRLVGPNFSYLLPAALVVGAIFVLGSFVLLQITFGSTYENMLGMFISIGGSAVFLVTALRGKGGARGEFK